MARFIYILISLVLFFHNSVVSNNSYSESEIKRIYSIHNNLQKQLNKNNYTSSFKDIEECIHLSIKLNNTQLLAKSYLYKVNYLEIHNENNEALAIADIALSLVNPKNLDLTARLYYVKASVFNKIGNYVKAFSFYSKAMELFKKAGNIEYTGKTCNQIGLIFNTFGQEDIAFDYFQKSISYLKSIKRYDLINGVNINLANIYASRKDYGISNKMLLTGYNNGNTYERINALITLGSNASALNELERADSIYSIVLKLALNYEDLELLVPIYNNLGALNAQLYSKDKAESYFLKAISLAEHYGNKYIQMKSSLGLAQLYQQNNEWKQSALYYRKYALLHDSLLNNQKALQIAGIHLKYEYVEKENEMKFLKKEAELAKKRTTILVILSIACIAIIILFAIIILLQYRSVNQKKKINELETTRLKEKLKVEEELLKLQKDKHDFDIEQKNRELATSALQVSSKNEILIKIKKLSENQKKNVVSPDIFYNQLNNIVDENLKLDEGWSKFKLHFEKVHPDFFSKLKEIAPDLTENELRLCAYIRINLRIKEIAQMLYISDDAVKTTRYRIKRKFELDNTVNLEDFIRNM